MNLTLGAQEYSAFGKLDAFAQLHIARKLGPALPIVEGLVSAENAGKSKSLLIVLMLSHINDTDTEYVVKKCLSVVGRKQVSGQFAKIQSADGSLMFDDISMSDLLELTVAVIEENLGDFFRTALADLAQAEKNLSS